MTAAQTPRTISESSRFIDVGAPPVDESLGAVVTHPAAGRANGVGVVIIHGGGTHNLPSHRNRWTVTFARQLAARGFTVMRVAYRGVGESSGAGQIFNLSNPFVDDGMAIVNAVIAEPGVERVVIVGSCFGARTALAVADRHDAVSGVVASALPIADHEKKAASDATVGELMKRGFGSRGLGGLFMAGRRQRYIRILKNKARSMLRIGGGGRSANPTPWVADVVVRGLRSLAARGGRALLVYGSADHFYTHFQEAQAGPLGILAMSPAITVDVSIDGRLHGYPSVAVQDAFVERTIRWLEAL
jgi:pimeloyl-ACP methyl ester carboxylesterase